MKMMKLVTRAFLFLLCFTPFSYADRVSYNHSKSLNVESEQLLVEHHHDWSAKKVRELFYPVTEQMRIFSSENDFSWLKVTDKKSGEVLFHSPVPALTYLWISEDHNYIIGLSNIKRYNPYQLVVFNRNGLLLHKEHITTGIAVLTQDEYRTLLTEYPKSKTIFEAFSRRNGDTIYLYFLGNGVAQAIEDEAWSFLYKRAQALYSTSFRESVTTNILWYEKENPELRIESEEGDSLILSLLDKRGKRFKIHIGTHQPSKIHIDVPKPSKKE